MKHKKIVVYDGSCRFCSKCIALLERIDKHKTFKHLSNLSQEYKQIQADKNEEPLNSIVFINEESHYTESDAILQICKELGRGYQFLYIFRYIPLKIRNGMYKLIARNRYLFGNTKECEV